MKNVLNLSEAGNLAIHALAYMSNLGPNKPVSATRIAQDIGVSESHLSKVLQKLARDGIISSIRGAKGGFYFKDDPAEMTLLEVLVKVDGPIPEPSCLLGNPVCVHKKCKLHDLMFKAGELVKEELGNIKLKDLIIKEASLEK